MGTITIELSDITALQTDAIVNAANPYLTNGSGVAGAIRVAADPEFQVECDQLAKRRPLGVGEVAATAAPGLPCKWVIHTVGPVWGQQSGEESRLLARSHSESVRLAAELGAKTLAFPAISTGIFGYPVDLAAPIAIEATREALDAHPQVEEARFCLFSQADLALFERALTQIG